MLNRKLVKIAVTSYALLVCVQGSVGQEDLKRFVYAEPHLGTLVTMTCYHEDSIEMAQLADSAFWFLEQLNLVFSDYDDRSEVRKLNQKKVRGPVPISSDLADLLRKADHLSTISDGAFDPYIGRLTHLWKRAFRRNRWPGKGKIRRAERHSGMDKVELDTTIEELRYLHKGIEIDLGGIGKGYIGDRMSAWLSKRGVTSHLIDLGGDLIAGDPPPGQEGWRISLDGLEEVVISNQAIATSGTTYQYLTHRGQTYSHLIDPRTGYGLGGKVTATVLAATGTEADALASALPFLSEETREKIFGGRELKFWLRKPK